MNEKERQIRYCYTNISWEIRRLKHLEGCEKAEKRLRQALKELEKELSFMNLGDVPNPMWEGEEE